MNNIIKLINFIYFIDFQNILRLSKISEFKKSILIFINHHHLLYLKLLHHYF